MATRKRAASAGRGSVGKPARRGYDGPVREQLTALQRARMVSAMFEVCSERGAGNVSVAHVVARSGVSRRTFYEVFEDREDCMLAAYEQALGTASERVVPAFEQQKGWLEGLRAGLVAFLSFLDEQPTVGRLLVAESLAGGPRVLARRSETLAQLIRIVEQGGREGKGETAGPLTAEGVVGGALSVIQRRLTENRTGSLLELTNPLMSMIVMPYFGNAAARRELTRAIPKSNVANSNGAHAAIEPQAPFKDLGIRLTYRTVRVLVAVAENPDGSNRAIGESAGMTDQGQISKLLARLARIGLVANTFAHPGKGAPNSWVLTERGARVIQTIRVHGGGLTGREGSDV